MSLPEDNQQLRKFSRAVMRGEMTRSEYQQQRRRMIDGYTGDTGAADDMDTTNPGDQPAVAALDSTLPKQARAGAPDITAVRAPLVVPDQSQPADNRDLWVGLVASLAVFLIIVGLLAYVFS